MGGRESRREKERESARARNRERERETRERTGHVRERGRVNAQHASEGEKN